MINTEYMKGITFYFMSKRSKRILAVLACCVLCFSSAAAADLRVVATFYPLYISLLNITAGVDGVTAVCLAPVQAGCLHDYQMSTADRRALADADVLIYNGAGLESFLEELFPTLSAFQINASQGAVLLPGHHDPTLEGDVNPHIWVDPRGTILQVRNIAEGLSLADPEHAEQYTANADAYIARLEDLDSELREALAPYSGTPVVTFHEAFDYLADACGFRVVAVMETDVGSSPSPQALAELIGIIRTENVSALFSEAQYDEPCVGTISRETGLPVYILDPVVSGPIDPNAYLDAMHQNLSTLLEAFE